MLTSMLRGVGIPAHPVTADADYEGGRIKWSFDTWTELLTPSGEWLVLHPHEGDSKPALHVPQTRSSFGTFGAFSNKAANDLVVMADENWVWNEISDMQTDATFSRNGCGEPNPTITKKPWVAELCEAGYWTPNHWDCGSLGTRSLRSIPKT